MKNPTRADPRGFGAAPNYKRLAPTGKSEPSGKTSRNAKAYRKTLSGKYPKGNKTAGTKGANVQMSATAIRQPRKQERLKRRTIRKPTGARF